MVNNPQSETYFSLDVIFGVAVAVFDHTVCGDCNS